MGFHRSTGPQSCANNLVIQNPVADSNIRICWRKLLCSGKIRGFEILGIGISPWVIRHSVHMHIDTGGFDVWFLEMVVGTLG